MFILFNSQVEFVRFCDEGLDIQMNFVRIGKDRFLRIIALSVKQGQLSVIFKTFYSENLGFLKLFSNLRMNHSENYVSVNQKLWDI